MGEAWKLMPFIAAMIVGCIWGYRVRDGVTLVGSFTMLLFLCAMAALFTRDEQRSRKRQRQAMQELRDYLKGDSNV